MGTLKVESGRAGMSMVDKKPKTSIGNSGVGMSNSRADWQRMADQRAATSGNGKMGRAHPAPSRVMSRNNGRRSG